MPDTGPLFTKPATLGDWVEFFDEYFHYPNRRQWKEGFRPLAHFTDRLAELGGYITSSKHQSGDKFRKYYAKYFAWYCSLVAQACLDIETAIWTKFPRRCPYCGLEVCAFLYNPGMRHHRTADRWELRRIAAEQLKADPALASRSLSQWFAHFISIYPINLHRSFGDITERFHEEQSELIKVVREANAFRQGSDGALADSPARIKVLEELSDLISWFLTLGASVLTNRRDPLGAYPEFLSRDPSGRLQVDFDEFIFGVYREGCPDCGRKPCGCDANVATDRSDLKEEPAIILHDNTHALTEWLRSTRELDLSAVRVIGRFVAGTAEQRGELKRVVEDLRTRITTLKKPFCVLLCGGPGVGKTFFVRELVADFGISEKNYLKRDLSQGTDVVSELSDLFLKVLGAGTPRVAFIDEVDTAIGGENAYRFLLAAMKGDDVRITATHSQPLPGVLMFFAASKGVNVSQFRAYLGNTQKGADFLRRFEESGEIIELSAALTPQDKVMQAIATAFSVEPNLEEVEARVLQYFGARDWSDAGALKGAVCKAMERANGRILTVGAIADFSDFTAVAVSGSQLDLGRQLIRVRPPR